MTAPFSPVHIPFISGVRQDLGKIAQESPAQLRQAQNVVFTRKGHITGRPGLVTRDAQTQLGSGSALLGSLATAVGSATPSGLVATGFQGTNKADSETALACWQGQSYFNRAGLWEFAGTHWSLRQTKSAVFEAHDSSPSTRGRPIPVGTDVVGVLTTVGGTTGIPFVSSSGDIKWVGTASTSGPGNFADPNKLTVAAAGNAVFWRPSVGPAVYGHIPTASGPVTTEILVFGAAAGQQIAATTDGSNYYVLVGANVVKIDSTGAVIQTLPVVFAASATAGNIGPVDICYDPTTNRLGLVVTSIAPVAVATKIITLVAGVMADAAIDLTLTGGGTVTAESVCAGVSHNGRMSVIFARPATTWTTGALSALPSGTVYVGGRLFTAATETSITTLTGAVNTSQFGRTWDPLFAGRAVAGRTLVGVMNGGENQNTTGQWVVMDFTSLYASNNTTERTVVACGPVDGAERCIPSSVYSDSTKVAFGVSEGILFSSLVGGGSTPGVVRGVARRITLEVQGVQASHIHDVTMLSGQLLHVFDGAKIRPHHFPEERPYIFNGGAGFVYTSGGGALDAGSYAYQATWEAVNGQGQTTRSGASNILTVNGVTAAQKVTLHVTKPQLWNNATPSEFVRVRLWATKTNPLNVAPKYLVTETVTFAPSTGFDEVMVHSVVASGLEEQLYETSDTLSDMRAPGADRGIAVVAERAWCADQTKLYASKIIRPNIGVSWNTEDTNVLTLPATLGTIQGLAAVNQGLVVLCSHGAAVVTGPGVDDTGAGPGWVLQIIDGVPGMGNSSPRSLVSTAAGVAFQAQDGDIWLANSAGQAVPLSRPLRDSAIINAATGIDVVDVSPTPSSNAMLIAHGITGILRVLDLEMGQWGTWTFPAITPASGLFLAAINGALWIQATSPGPVYSASDFTSVGDAGLGAFTATIETGVLRQANPVPHGWGRLRAVTLNEVRKLSDTQVSVNIQVLADQNDRVLMNKTLSTNPTDTATFTGAGDGVLTFGTTVQRCAYARVLMTITPAIFNAEGLDLWVANTGERAPSNNRS